MNSPAERIAPQLNNAKYPLYALTLRPPWGYAVLHLGKDIENRVWRPRQQITEGMEFCIHGGALSGWDEEGARWIESKFGVTLPEKAKHPRGLLCTRVFGGVVTDSLSPWHARGQYGWKIGSGWDFSSPIEVGGQQRLWRVKGELLESVRQARRTAAFVQLSRF